MMSHRSAPSNASATRTTDMSQIDAQTRLRARLSTRDDQGCALSSTDAQINPADSTQKELQNAEFQK